MREEKIGRGVIAPKAVAVCFAIAVVCGAWCTHHNDITVHRTIDCQATKIFTWFAEQVAEARRSENVDKSKAMLAEVFNLLGKSAYQTMVEVGKRQICVIFTKDQEVVDRALQSVHFTDLDELGQAYEVESRTPRILFNRSFTSRNHCHLKNVNSFARCK